MEEALTYLATLMLFSFVLVGAALIRHDMLLLASIPPVFVAMITGFVMVLYAEGYSVTNFLVGSSNRKVFLDFVAAGMRGDWDKAEIGRAHV